MLFINLKTKNRNKHVRLRSNRTIMLITLSEYIIKKYINPMLLIILIFISELIINNFNYQTI